MRCGIDARFYGILGKGLGRYTEKLIQSLEQLETDDEYVIFLRKENFDSYTPKSPRFRKVLADFPWYSLAEQTGFVRLLYRERIDLMHFPHFNVPLLYGRPFVVTVHDLILLHHPTRRASTHTAWWYGFKFFMYRIVIRAALWRARTVLAVSEFTRQDLLKQYPFLARRNVVVTLEGVDTFCHWVSPREREIFLKKLFPDGILRPYLLYVGNAYPHKNLERLIEAIAGESEREVCLVLVGREDYFYRRLRQVVEQRRIPRVFFAGEVSDRVLSGLYRGARGYIFPSLYEGFGLPPLEAMMLGVPVASSQTTSLPEVLGEAALYFDPYQIESMREAVRCLWDDAVSRQSLQAKGYERVQHFSWERMGRETADIYKNV